MMSRSAAEREPPQMKLAKLICPEPFGGHPYNTKNKKPRDATKPQRSYVEEKQYLSGILHSGEMPTSPPEECHLGSSHKDAVEKLLPHLHN